MSNSKDSLTHDEQILHHHAAVLKQNLEAYRACSARDEGTWTKQFRALLTKSMNYFVRASDGNPNRLRVHPLLLSLTAAFAKSDQSPDIGSVSENDPRVLSSQHYTSPSDLPPLNIHFPGQNTLCQECMVSKPQVNMGAHEVEPDIQLPITDAEPIPSDLVDNAAGASNMVSVSGRERKRRRPSVNTIAEVHFTRSAVNRKAIGDDAEAAVDTMEVKEDENVLGGPPNTRGLKAARLQDRVKGKSAITGFPNRARPGARTRGQQAEEMCPRNTPTPSAEEVDETGKPMPPLSQNRPSETKEGENQIGILDTVHALIMEVQTLKGRCDRQEKIINNLESRCDTHEKVIEMLRQEIVGLKDSQNDLSTTYHGERYDLIP